MLLTLGRIAVGLAATALLATGLRSALRTIVLPRGVPDRLTRVVFRMLDVPTAWRAGRASSSPRLVDRRTATLATRVLLAHAITWLASLWLAGAGVQWALTAGSAGAAFSVSAAALTCLGLPPAEGPATAACQELAAVGLPVVSDLEAAYNRFRVHRAKYDGLLLALCAYLFAPPAPWSSDKAGGDRPRSPIIRLGPGSLGRVYPRPALPPGGNVPGRPPRPPGPANRD